MKQFYVYILASRYKGTFYVGVTSDLVSRVYQHKEQETEGFTARHNVHRLVWFEEHSTAEAAIRREKRLKRWNRDWKIRMIEEENPKWDDLYYHLLGIDGSPPKNMRG